MKGILAAGAVAAVMVLPAPAASAAEPAEAMQDCTTEYVRTLATGSNDPLVEVTYTPPATVTVNADHAVNVVNQVVDATVTYVDCVV